ncbi:MAG TPA: glucose-6-phosphate dehydrogenase, partial [Opitutaceae bacterium]|nr:glucose-6-phosphate dehydrogenase [Opitutaceae bacterium]
MTEGERHPFLRGLSIHRGAPPTVAVIFGASGDLTSRKLIPAIYNLAHDNLLPSDFKLIGYSRKDLSDDDFRKIVEDALKEFSRRPPDPQVLAR